MHEYGAPVYHRQDRFHDVARDDSVEYAFRVSRRRDPHEFYERMIEVIRAVRLTAAPVYAKLELGSAQAKILRHIGRNSRISQADLARATDTAPTLTGRAIEPLVTRGLVRRKRSDEDRREYVLELTAEGKRMRDKVEEARNQIIARFGEVLDDRDLDDFDRISAKLLSTLASGV